MRKFLVIAVFAFVTVAMLAPPVLAQAPAPKVTITGLFDQVTSFGKNYNDGNASRDSDHEWYARTRFRPDFTFEVGRTKAVMGLEIDLTYGRIGQSAGGPGKNVSATGTAAGGLDKHGGTTADSSLNTDVTGVIEMKWMYTEFDLTGKDSLLPFIPVETRGRAGLQSFGDLTDKTKVAYATGDFPGFSATTTFAPNLKTKLAYVVVESEVGGGNRGAGGTGGLKGTRGHDFAVIEVVATGPLESPCSSAGAVAAANLALDDDVGELGLEVRGECCDRREAGEIAGRVGNLGLVGEVAEGLETRPAPGLDRYERQQAVLAGQVELRVHPLHLDDASDVRVQTGVGRGPAVFVEAASGGTGSAHVLTRTAG